MSYQNSSAAPVRCVGGFSFFLLGVAALLTLAGTAALNWQAFGGGFPIGAQAAKADDPAAKLAEVRKKVAAEKGIPEATRTALDKDFAEVEGLLSRRAAAGAGDPGGRLAAIEGVVRQIDERTKKRFDQLDKKLDIPLVPEVPPAPPARPTDVLVVALHSSNLAVSLYRQAIYNVFKPTAARPKSIRVGFLLAIGGEVAQVPAARFGEAPDLGALDRLGAKPAGVTDHLADIAPVVESRFDPPNRTARRVVVVCGDRAPVPTPGPDWKAGVDAILLAETPRVDAENVVAWHKFTAARGGSVVLLVTEKDEPLKQFEEHLARLLNPAPQPEK